MYIIIVYIHIYTYIHTYIYIYIYTYVYIYIYIYTFIHFGSSNEGADKDLVAQKNMSAKVEAPRQMMKGGTPGLR